jgi:hypothetical protein
MKPKDVYEVTTNGGHITDDDLLAGIIFFKDLSDNLFKVGPTFRLAAAEANHTYFTLRDFAVNRELRIKKGY